MTKTYIIQCLKTSRFVYAYTTVFNTLAYKFINTVETATTFDTYEAAESVVLLNRYTNCTILTVYK